MKEGLGICEVGFGGKVTVVGEAMERLNIFADVLIFASLVVFCVSQVSTSPSRIVIVDKAASSSFFFK